MTSRNWTPPISPAPRAEAHLKCGPGPSLSSAPLTRKFGRAQRGADRAPYFPESERTWCWRWSVRGGRRRRPARAGHTGARPGSAVAATGRAGQQAVGSKVSRPPLLHTGQAGRHRRGHGAGQHRCRHPAGNQRWGLVRRRVWTSVSSPARVRTNFVRVRRPAQPGTR